MTNKSHHINRPITIAKLGRPYGLKGWMFVQSFANPAEQLFEYSPLYLKSGNDYRAITVTNYKQQGEKYILHVEGYDSPEAAKTLTNQLITIDHSQLAELKEGQYYWSDLEGLNVINKLNEQLGVIDHIINTGANDILVVKGEKENLIPYSKQHVLSVDLKNKIMTVDWEIDF